MKNFGMKFASLFTLFICLWPSLCMSQTVYDDWTWYGMATRAKAEVLNNGSHVSGSPDIDEEDIPFDCEDTGEFAENEYTEDLASAIAAVSVSVNGGDDRADGIASVWCDVPEAYKDITVGFNYDMVLQRKSTNYVAKSRCVSGAEVYRRLYVDGIQNNFKVKYTIALAYQSPSDTNGTQSLQTQMYIYCTEYGTNNSLTVFYDPTINRWKVSGTRVDTNGTTQSVNDTLGFTGNAYYDFYIFVPKGLTFTLNGDVEQVVGTFDKDTSGNHDGYNITRSTGTSEVDTNAFLSSTFVFQSVTGY